MISTTVLRQISTKLVGVGEWFELELRHRDETLRDAVMAVGDVDLASLPPAVADLIRAARQHQFGVWAGDVAVPSSVDQSESEETAKQIITELNRLREILAYDGCLNDDGPETDISTPFIVAATDAVSALEQLRESLPAHDYSYDDADVQALSDLHDELPFTLAFIESLSAAWAGCDDLTSVEQLSADAHKRGRCEAQAK